MSNQADPDSGREIITSSGQKNWIRELQLKAHRSHPARPSEAEALTIAQGAVGATGKPGQILAKAAVEKPKTEIAGLCLAKAEYALDCTKNPEAARKAASEGIELLKDAKDAAEGRLLIDLYMARAEAHAALGNTGEAAKDLKLARAGFSTEG